MDYKVFQTKGSRKEMNFQEKVQNFLDFFIIHNKLSILKIPVLLRLKDNFAKFLFEIAPYIQI